MVFPTGHALAVENSAWAKPLAELRILRIVVRFGFFFSVEVVAEKHIEPMIGRQELVLIAQMVLAKLASRIA